MSKELLSASERRKRALEQFEAPTWSLEDVAQAADCTRKFVHNNLTRLSSEILQLQIEKVGKGHKRLFSASEAVFFAALAELSRLAIPPSKAATVAGPVRRWASEPNRILYYESYFRGLKSAYVLVHRFDDDDVEPVWCESLAVLTEQSEQVSFVVIDVALLVKVTIEKLWAPYLLRQQERDMTT